MTSQLEKTVRAEQEAHDDAEAEERVAVTGSIPKHQLADDDEQPADDDTNAALFDPGQYETEELALPKVDGHGVDKIRIGFTGSVMLDRSDPRDVAVFRNLALGKDVELRVAGDVTATKTGWTTNREGDLDAIVGERTIRVGTVYVLQADQL